jgi:hypothetical protein
MDGEPRMRRVSGVFFDLQRAGRLILAFPRRSPKEESTERRACLIRIGISAGQGVGGIYNLPRPAPIEIIVTFCLQLLFSCLAR